VQDPKYTGSLTAAKLLSTMTAILRLTQGAAFYEELKELQNKKPVSEKSQLSSLNPFLSSNGM
jgi:hypothetical protein